MRIRLVVYIDIYMLGKFRYLQLSQKRTATVRGAYNAKVGSRVLRLNDLEEGLETIGPIKNIKGDLRGRFIVTLFFKVDQKETIVLLGKVSVLRAVT